MTSCAEASWSSNNSWYPISQQALEKHAIDHSIPLTSMQTSMNFGGPSGLKVDQEYAVSLHHIIQDHGSFAGKALHLVDKTMQISNNEAEQDLAIELMGLLGITAGRLFFKSQKGGGLVSGFWLAPDKFITCAHFTTDIKSYLNERIDGLKTTQSDAHVCSHNIVCPELGNQDIRVQLLKIDYDNDIAIFQAATGQESKLEKLKSESNGRFQFIDPNNLSSLFRPVANNTIDNHEQFSIINSQELKVFSCGYSVKDFGVGGLPDDSAIRLWVEQQKQTIDGVFEAYIRKSLYDISASADHMNASNKFTGLKFEDIYKANARAGACGEIQTEYNTGTPGFLEIEHDRLTHVMNHTISSFHGCSGGLVARFIRDANQDGGIKLEIVGIIQGSSDGLMNSFLAFTPKGIEQLINPTLDINIDESMQID